MSIGYLPQTLTVGGREWRIRTDYRNILRIFEAMNDRELEHEEKIYIMLYILYVDIDKMPAKLYREAAEQANWFIEAGQEEDTSEDVRKMDWKQDESIIFPAVNAVAGKELREEKQVHWWTFLGYFMEIREGIFATVIHIRTKKLDGKKLDKWEREFYQKNKKICDLRVEKTEDEKKEEEEINKLLG